MSDQITAVITFSTWLSLQKQGVLPLWFADKRDYSSIAAGDTVETEGLANVLAGDTSAQIRIVVKKRGRETVTIDTRHTLSADQVQWIRAGSALNMISELQRQKSSRS